MLIAIDWDGTFTKDKIFWMKFIELISYSKNVEYIIATGRDSQIEIVKYLRDNIPRSQMPVGIVLCGDDYKRKAVEKHGFQVDVWIDNEPGTIEPGRKLIWNDIGEIN